MTPPADRTARRRPGRRAVAALAPLAALALVASGCTADDAEPTTAYAPPSASATVPLLVPGGPGDPVETVAPEDVTAPTGPEPWTDADAAFFQQMVTHHRQAVEMSALAADRAGDPDVAAIAERIGLGQEPEVDVMVAWLEERGLDVPPEQSWLSGRGEVTAEGPGHDGHGAHGGSADGGMHGMATAAEVQQLAAAEGEEFDALYVDLMVRHHTGALSMVDEHQVGGVDVRVQEMADDVAAVQAAEIRHLEDMRPR